MRDPNEYIDEIVKEGEGSSFQYKNAYWEEMASLLDANDLRKKRKAILLWTSSAASLLILVVASWAILGSDILYQERPENQIASFSENNVSYYMQQYEVIANNADDLFVNQQQPSMHSTNTQNTRNAILSNNTVTQTNEGADNTFDNAASTQLNDVASNELDKLDAIAPQLIDNKKQDNVIQSSEQFEFPPVVEGNFASRHHLNIDGGVGISGLTGVQGTQLSYQAGLTYSYDLDENWSIQTGLRYLSQGIHLQKTENYSKYSFKRTDEQVHLNYDRLHYAQMPVGVSFKNKRSMFSFNLTPGYVVAVESSYQHTRFDHDTKSYNTLQETKSNYGIDEGINKFDLQVGLSYEYALTSFMNIGASANIGTLDITENKYWGVEEKNLNYNATAFLKFNLF